MTEPTETKAAERGRHADREIEVLWELRGKLMEPDVPVETRHEASAALAWSAEEIRSLREKVKQLVERQR